MSWDDLELLGSGDAVPCFGEVLLSGHEELDHSREVWIGTLCFPKSFWVGASRALELACMGCVPLFLSLPSVTFS